MKTNTDLSYLHMLGSLTQRLLQCVVPKTFASRLHEGCEAEAGIRAKSEERATTTEAFLWIKCTVKKPFRIS